MAFRLLLFCPSRVFESEEALKSADPTGCLEGLRLALFDSSAIGVVIGNEIHWEATMFLAENSMFGRSQTGDTVRTYGEGLTSYLNHLETQGLVIEEISERLLQSYRNWLISRSRVNENLSARTVNLRITTVCAFHYWGESRGHFSSPLGKLLLANRGIRYKNPRALLTARLHSHADTPKFWLALEKKIPRVLSQSEVRALFQVSLKPFSLMFKWACVTGMRRFEICSLRISELPPRSESSESGLREMRITRKGGKEVTVYVPNALVDETWWYIITDRPRPFAADKVYVFLSRNGKQIGRNYLSSMFKKYAEKIATGATLHHLRHTFAVLSLTILQQRAEQGDSINPLKTLQVLMGHSSIDSTEIYLRALDIHSEAVEETLNFLYGDAL
jgi:integrase